jgi:hypothetical protein
MQLWAVFEQYASGKRDENHKFEDSSYFHVVYDSAVNALEQLDRLPTSGELFRQHRKHLRGEFWPTLRETNMIPPVIFHVLPGEEDALRVIQAESSTGSYSRNSRKRRVTSTVVDDFEEA